VLRSKLWTESEPDERDGGSGDGDDDLDKGGRGEGGGEGENDLENAGRIIGRDRPWDNRCKINWKKILLSGQKKFREQGIGESAHRNRS
jgi:hypothetical protein